MAKHKQKAPGKFWRKGLSLFEIMDLFPTNEVAEEWFIKTRWPAGIACQFCGSMDIQKRKIRQPFRCRDCRKNFSVTTGTLMHSTKLGLRIWAVAIYLHATGIKGTSSTALARNFKITQKSAWHLMHRIREAWNDEPFIFTGPVEVDEVWIGGREPNKHANKKINAGGGSVGKAVVVGVKDRESNFVKASVVSSAGKKELQGFVMEQTALNTPIFSDDHYAYRTLPNHEMVKHSVGEYVRGQVHTNGIESFWALLKRGYYGTYHRMSFKHLQRYVNEFAGRHNVRPLDTIEQMKAVVVRMDGKRLRYRDLIA